jgi:hypothetical protein
MSGMEILGAGLTVAGAATKAFADRRQGQAQKAALDYQAQQQRAQAEYTQIQGQQDAAGRRNALTSSLENMNAIIAGRGVGLASPTNAAITTGVVDRGERDIASAALGYQAKASQLTTGAQLSTQQGAFAETAGNLAAVSDIVGAGAGITNLYTYGKTKTSLV